MKILASKNFRTQVYCPPVNVGHSQVESLCLELVLLPHLHEPVHQDAPHGVGDVRLFAHVVVLSHEFLLVVLEKFVDFLLEGVTHNLNDYLQTHLEILRRRQDVHGLGLVLAQGRDSPVGLAGTLKLAGAGVQGVVHLHVARVVGETLHGLKTAEDGGGGPEHGGDPGEGRGDILLIHEGGRRGLGEHGPGLRDASVLIAEDGETLLLRLK